MTKELTPFEQAKLDVAAGKRTVPVVSNGDGTVPFFGYQLAIHKMNLGLMAVGVKFPVGAFTEIKKYYGLTGRTAEDCLPQLKQIVEDYKANLRTA